MTYGVLQNEAIASYHASTAVSSTKLMDLQPTPAYFFGRYISKTIPKPNKKAFEIGNAAHPLILEGEAAYKERVIIHPEFYVAKESQKKDSPLVSKDWTWQSDACKAWRKPHLASGKIVLSREDEEITRRMALSVPRQPFAQALLTGGDPEVTFRRKNGMFDIQCRPDMWHPHGIPECGLFNPVIVDLKTCETIEQFRSHCFSFRYAFRAEFYKFVVRAVLADMGGIPFDDMPEPEFYFVVVEKFPTHRCKYFKASNKAKSTAKDEVYAALKQLEYCYRTGIWEDAPQTEAEEIDITPWQQRASDLMTSEILEGVQ